MPFKCPKCNHEFYERLKYCPECGLDFSVGQKRCPKCRSQVADDSQKCPECGLDFEKYSFFIPQVVAFGITALLVILVVISPYVLKATPALHDKGIIVDGQLRSDIEGQAMVPMFIHWKTGERYIEKSAEASGYSGDTDYMNNLIPLPHGVIFHYDIPAGERVWIIRRVGAGRIGATVGWLQIGRWSGDNDKYGWIHESNISVE